MNKSSNDEQSSPYYVTTRASYQIKQRTLNTQQRHGLSTIVNERGLLIYILRPLYIWLHNLSSQNLPKLNVQRTILATTTHGQALYLLITD